MNEKGFRHGYIVEVGRLLYPPPQLEPEAHAIILQRELKELIDKNILITTGATSNLIYEMQVKSKQD